MHATVSKLAIGVPIWFDIAMHIGTAGTATIYNPQISGIEL
jgi:hypothetical protein